MTKQINDWIIKDRPLFNISKEGKIQKINIIYELWCTECDNDEGMFFSRHEDAEWYLNNIINKN
jgi:hypothetical protein